MVKWKFFVILCLFICSINSQAQQRQLHFEHLGLKDGLSELTVNCILQDRQGFMWLGSQDGLNRYDGYSFKVFRNNGNDKASISNNFITNLIEDADGDLWITTLGGLNRFVRKTNQFIRYRHNEKNKNSIASDNLKRIVADKDGTFWIATADNGLDHFDPRSNSFEHFKNDQNPASISENNLNTVFIDHKNNIWVGTQNKGLNLFDRATRSFKRFAYRDDQSNSISGNNVNFIYEDSAKRLWISAGTRGLNLFEPAKNDFQHFNQPEIGTDAIRNHGIQCIGEDDHGNLWVGTENGGLCIFNYERNTLIRYFHDDVDNGSLTNNSIDVILKDQADNMWVSTFSGGVNLLKKSKENFAWFRHSSAKGSLSNDFVLCFLEDTDSNLWIGTDGGGLNRLNRQTGQFVRLKLGTGKQQEIGNFVLKVEEDDHKNLWIATWNDGLIRYNLKTHEVKNYRHDDNDASSIGANNIYNLIIGTDGKLWIGTFGGGLDSYDPGDDKFVHHRHDVQNKNTIADDRINSILQDKNGLLWVGTNASGIDIFDPVKNSFKHIKQVDKNSFNNNPILDIYQDHQDNVWICTMTGLSVIYANGEKSKTFTVADGLPNNNTFAVQEDRNHNLWISTNTGISRYDASTKRFTNFTDEDGLQVGAFKPHSAMLDASGDIYFGGVNGYNVFSPQTVGQSKYNPKLAFTDLLLFNKSVEVSMPGKPSPLKQTMTETKEIELSYEQSVLSLQFASLDYLSPVKKSYAYKLIGFDKEWNFVGHRNSAVYTNLPGGDYVLMVKSQSDNGMWSSKMLELNIKVLPPWWETWWFRILFVVGVGLTVYSIYRWRVREILKQKTVLKEQVEKRTETISQQSQTLKLLNSELLAQSEELQSINEELHAQSDELAKQRQEEYNLRKEADKANEAKGLFLATMSHEIRTPMNGVVGMAALLNQTELTPEQREYTDTIITCGDSLVHVINDILDFTKIESGKLELEMASFNIRRCVEQVMDIFLQEAARKGISLIYQIAADLPDFVIGDSLRLKQVMINLVNNALKFTAEGEIFVNVHLIRSSPGKSVKIGITVQDSGIGIPEEKIPLLFKAFSQIDSSITRRYGGSGLGLAISERLVGLMGGNIWVKNNTEAGATFGFEIEVLRSPERNTAQPDIAAIAGHKVLIISASQLQQQVLKDQLYGWNMQVFGAQTWDEALRYLDKETVDLLLVDIGNDAEKDQLLLYKSKTAKRTPIIELLTIGNNQTISGPESTDMKLIKPVKQRTLYQAINSALAKQGQSQQVSEVAQSSQELFSESYPLSILVAEDNLINQKLIKRIMEKMGYDIQIASNGNEVLALVEQNSFELILMDIQMPELDGLDTTRILRKSDLRQPYISAMTANAMPEDKSACLAAGMDDYISKPMKLEELMGVIRRAFAHAIVTDKKDHAF
ncbi:response regulator [Mucilaginibacter sp. JRF]|uniref:hybrid sensor histidine kinase/response regulator n=1 Tax=Mucilaginibacter sp. JRF TaxID=2780088 RepID=UPI00188059EC|nr:two-component regulator propeller domain-containing protein [Mucilaginibacter sp. JRF]MBE9583093.1 response regulator [Mucilaginibacter sp. JRF]